MTYKIEGSTACMSSPFVSQHSKVMSNSGWGWAVLGGACRLVGFWQLPVASHPCPAIPATCPSPCPALHPAQRPAPRPAPPHPAPRPAPSPSHFLPSCFSFHQPPAPQQTCDYQVSFPWPLAGTDTVGRAMVHVADMLTPMPLTHVTSSHLAALPNAHLQNLAREMGKAKGRGNNVARVNIMQVETKRKY